MKIDNFCRLPGTSAQCVIGKKKYPDISILLKYDDDEYSQDSGHIKETFRALTKMISFNQIYVLLISDLQLLELMILDKISTFSIYDISIFLKLPNQLK